MHANGLSIAALLSVHLGFAAVLGVLTRLNLSRSAGRRGVVSLVAAGLLFAAANMALPFAGSLKLAIGILSVICGGLVYWQFERLRAHLDWAWLYAGAAMGLILAWSIAQTQPLPAFFMSLAAGLAAILALRRGVIVRFR